MRHQEKPVGKKRLKEYIELIKKNKNKIISFQLNHKENIWTTKEIFNVFGIKENNPIKTSGQYMATILIMQKCDAIINLFKKCIYLLKKNPLLITDYYNKNQRYFFKDNRHDQSILSIIRKLHGSIVIKDETNLNYKSKEIIPFLSTRKRKS